MGDNIEVLPQGVTPDQVQAVLEMLNDKKNNMQLAELKEAGFTKNDFRQEQVRQFINKHYSFVRVRGVGEAGTIYFQPINEDGLTPQHAYRQLTDIDANNIVRDAFVKMFNIAPADKVKTAVETLKMGVTDEIESVNNNLIQLTDDLYWDVDEAQLTEVPSSACMRELFDSRGTNEITIDLHEMNASIIRAMYKKTLSWLEESDGVMDPLNKDDLLSVENPTLLPFWTWSNEDPDTYNDLLKAVATNFMYNKPKGAFVLIGLKRNGKSTFLKMLHILFGRNNTSSVRLSDLNNHGLNGDLWTTMMNAPDEEDEGRGKDLLEAQGNFKSIAAHESLKLRQLYAQNGKWVNSDFMCFFPMNHFPEWKGNGAAACMHRTLPLFFNNDLSKFDNTGHDFVRETFTSYFYENLLGVTLAIAHYYRNIEMPFSQKMKADKARVAEEVDNISLYLDRFKSWFNGYKSKKLVFEDYKLWCRERDLRWQEYSVFSHSIEMRGPKISSLTVDDARLKVYRLGDRPGSDYFYEDCYVPKLHKRVVDIITTDTGEKRVERSVIAMLDELKDAQDNKIEEKSDNQEVLDTIKELWG